MDEPGQDGDAAPTAFSGVQLIRILHDSSMSCNFSWRKCFAPPSDCDISFLLPDSLKHVKLIELSTQPNSANRVHVGPNQSHELDLGILALSSSP